MLPIEPDGVFSLKREQPVVSHAKARAILKNPSRFGQLWQARATVRAKRIAYSVKSLDLLSFQRKTRAFPCAVRGQVFAKKLVIRWR